MAPTPGDVTRPSAGEAGVLTRRSTVLKKISVSVLALAVAGLSAPAMAVSSSGGSVNVNIDVQGVVSMWANDANVSLILNGANAENSDTSPSSLSVINNLDANIKAAVTGTLPADINGFNSVNFFIFNGTEANAQAQIIADSNTPVGALVWTNDNLGASQTLIASTGVNPSIVNKPIVYAADAPNVLPGVANWGLVVTYTITSN
jgi:hypothetical protein